jgi:hypothetical protein
MGLKGLAGRRGSTAQTPQSISYPRIKALFIFHNDAHNYKITGILKQLKF